MFDNLKSMYKYILSVSLLFIVVLISFNAVGQLGVFYTYFIEHGQITPSIELMEMSKIVLFKVTGSVILVASILIMCFIIRK